MGWSDGHAKNREAFHQGYAAFEAGKAQRQSPYRMGSTPLLAWLDGWIAAYQGLVNDPEPWGWLSPTPTSEQKDGRDV